MYKPGLLRHAHGLKGACRRVVSSRVMSAAEVSGGPVAPLGIPLVWLSVLMWRRGVAEMRRGVATAFRPGFGFWRVKKIQGWVAYSVTYFSYKSFVCSEKHLGLLPCFCRWD